MDTINRDEIARLLNEINNGDNSNIPSIIRQIDENLCWAWDNWDDELTANHYEFEKPKFPTYSFINEWVDNEDFEADGFNLEELKEL